MADMLTNTVGAVLFILIFTVLTAGGAVVVKRLPMERPTTAKPRYFVCVGGRVGALDVDADIDRFVDPLVSVIKSAGVERFLERFNAMRERIAAGVITGKAEIYETWGGRYLRAVVNLEPFSTRGETDADLAKPTSAYRAEVARLRTKDTFARFVVYPDGLAAFKTARNVAESTGIGTHWILMEAGEPIRVCLAGCGNSTIRDVVF